MERQINTAAAQRDISRQGYELYLACRMGQGTDVVSDVTLSAHEVGMYHRSPVNLTPEAAQSLIDDLWAAGLRPTHADREVPGETKWLREQLGVIIGKEWG